MTDTGTWDLPFRLLPQSARRIQERPVSPFLLQRPPLIVRQQERKPNIPSRTDLIRRNRKRRAGAA